MRQLQLTYLLTKGFKDFKASDHRLTARACMHTSHVHPFFLMSPVADAGRYLARGVTLANLPGDVGHMRLVFADQAATAATSQVSHVHWSPQGLGSVHSHRGEGLKFAYSWCVDGTDRRASAVEPVHGDGKPSGWSAVLVGGHDVLYV